MKKQTLSTLLKYLSEKGLYNSLGMFLEWDLETYMPPSGIDFRSQQMQYFGAISHKLMTSKKLENLLHQIDPSSLRDREKALLRETQKDFTTQKKLPVSFVKKFSATTSKAMHTWRKAKADNRFSMFAPHLKKIIALCRKKTEYLGYKNHPYDALLDLFEPEMTVAQLDPLFAKLKERLIHLLRKITEKKPRRCDALFQIHYPKYRQKILCKHVATKIGLDESCSNLSESSHPFCLANHPSDIRMTTFYDPSNFLSGFYATIHESGHGLYEKHLPVEYFGSPLCEASSHGIHESQSRFWETMIGHSKAFLEYYYDIICDTFPAIQEKVSREELYETINYVEPSLIRIFSDEVTYNLHIILRYEIEKALIEGSLSVNDIPKVWNQKMKESFQITPPSDQKGCLQDIHWSMGAFGYFPSYSLGNLYAGSLLGCLKNQIPSYEKKLHEGDFSEIRDFLRRNVHVYGREFAPKELIERATKKSFTVEDYLSYLETKYPL